MLTDNSGLSPFERLLTLFTRMRPGEGRSTFLFFLHGFLLLFSYLIVKALREAFILTDFSAEVRAYGVAVIALVLMFLVPAYGGAPPAGRGAAAAGRDDILRREHAGFRGRRLLRHIDFVHLLCLGQHLRMITAQFWALPPIRSTSRAASDSFR